MTRRRGKRPVSEGWSLGRVFSFGATGRTLSSGTLTKERRESPPSLLLKKTTYPPIMQRSGKAWQVPTGAAGGMPRKAASGSKDKVMATARAAL